MLKNIILKSITVCYRSNNETMSGMVSNSYEHKEVFKS